jgi:hypothetical protein
LTATQKVILEWHLKESPHLSQVDEFFIFREAVDVEAILGSDAMNRGSRNTSPTRRPRDYDGGNGGSSSISIKSSSGTVRGGKSGGSTNRGSSSNWPPKSRLQVLTKQVYSFFLLPRHVIANPITDKIKLCISP